MEQHDIQEVDLAEELGALGSTSIQLLTLYIPNKDKDGNEFGAQRVWVLDASKLLARIGGGVTIMPPCEGGWLNEETDQIVWESPVLVYTFIKADGLLSSLPSLRAFLHRMGRETNQGEVAFEFDGSFFRITEFDQ